MISTVSVLAPLFLEVALTFGLLLWFGARRVQAIRSREVRPIDVALRQPAWPGHILQIGNSYQNQLELPILFYLLIVLELLTATANTALLVLSWLFVVTRLLHALIHVTTNHMGRRFALFGTGSLILLVMWVVFAVGLMAG
jgi:hypothetical protein